MVVEWLKQHWFLFTALATCGVAWGQNTAKVSELQTRLDKAEAIVQQQNRIDERTKILQDDMKEQRAILVELLATQRAWAEKNRVVVPQAPVATPRAERK